MLHKRADNQQSNSKTKENGADAPFLLSEVYTKVHERNNNKQMRRPIFFIK